MRTPNIGSVQYAPGDPPSDPAQLQRYLREEFGKMSAAINALAAGHVDEVNAAPVKPRKGDFRLADGVSWNPGSGAGFYGYTGSAWQSLGGTAGAATWGLITGTLASQTDLNTALAAKEVAANKDASGGYAGLTLFKLNLVNTLGTITSWFTTAATVARTWTMPDKSGTVAMTSDITGTNSGTNTGDQTITLTGDVTGSGTGSFAATIAAGAVTLAKMADMATSSLIYRKTAGSGAPEVNTLATLKTDLSLTGTNSGDETTTTIGTLINGATAKTTPVDADFLGLMDSAASNVLKKLSWLNVKATLKTYFDTLYSAIAGSSSIVTVGTVTSGTWNGTAVDVAHGGTGAATLTAHGVVVGNGTGIVNITSAGTSGQVLTSNGPSADPTFQTTAGTIAHADAISGGAAGNVPYQSGAGVTAFVTNGTAGQVLTSAGAGAPVYSNVKPATRMFMNRNF